MSNCENRITVCLIEKHISFQDRNGDTLGYLSRLISSASLVAEEINRIFVFGQSVVLIVIRKNCFLLGPS